MWANMVREIKGVNGGVLARGSTASLAQLLPNYIWVNLSTHTYVVYSQTINAIHRALIWAICIHDHRI